ncbi:MAG: hypothetical protein ABIY70_00650 [Capsulimonas sp.]|uniref:hypothetical protein n=1 Tax=Capsulimonas sp. TaxID=2494211 RepID=UPI0032678E30
MNAKTAWIFGTLGAIAVVSLIVYIYHATDPAAQAPIVTTKFDMANHVQEMGQKESRPAAPQNMAPGTVVGETTH